MALIIAASLSAATRGSLQWWLAAGQRAIFLLLSLSLLLSLAACEIVTYIFIRSLFHENLIHSILYLAWNSGHHILLCISRNFILSLSLFVPCQHYGFPPSVARWWGKAKKKDLFRKKSLVNPWDHFFSCCAKYLYSSL